MRATVYRVSRRVLDFWRVCHEATRDMDIEPFHGYRYAGATRTDVSPIVAPPYDQISPETQERLHAMSPHNIVRATYPRDGGEKYRQAASVLGLSRSELAGLAANGVRASFLDSGAKQALLAEIGAVAAGALAEGVSAETPA